jgi:hypothetical protein
MWSEFRRRQVTQLVRQIYLRANAVKPSIKVSAALITWGGGPGESNPDASFRNLDAYSRVFQDWRGWLEEGILDLGIPMNYFVEERNAAFLTNWLNYEKDRAYRRGLLVGLGIYLNPLDATITQLQRALAPAASGNVPLGICFYSYASTNENQTTTNADFYRRMDEFFGSDSKPPELPWKTAPTGHLLGWLRVTDGPRWLNDGATIIVESDATGEIVRRLETDGNGFFGAVDLPPDRYFVRVERGGSEVYRSPASDLAAGSVAQFEIFLRAEDFQAVLPAIIEASSEAAAPGDIITLTGVNLAPATQVVVSGEAAGLYQVSPNEARVQMPLRESASWNVFVRRQAWNRSHSTCGMWQHIR